MFRSLKNLLFLRFLLRISKQAEPAFEKQINSTSPCQYKTNVFWITNRLIRVPKIVDEKL